MEFQFACKTPKPAQHKNSPFSKKLDVIDNGPHSVAVTKLRAAQVIAGHTGTVLSQCVTTGNATFEVHGKPGDATYGAKALAHERHHAADHLAGFNAVLVPWNNAIDASILAGTVYSGPDAAAAEANMWAAVGGTPDQIATRLHNTWIARNNAYHASAAGGSGTVNNGRADATFSTASFDHTLP
ncbi:MAG: hypothetical protein P8X90_21835 [Desulfobacterales bacterium]|jgi:hypothetical protein